MRLPLVDWRTALAAVALAFVATCAGAQTVEITPFGGYRVGGGFSQVGGRPVVDDDGGPSAGVIVDWVFGPPGDGLRVEALYSRERADLKVGNSLFDPPARVRVEVDQILVGGIQDLDDGRVRPFLAGLLGLTRYAAPDDTEVRFAIGVGAGIKVYATRHLGFRLDARGYMTVVNLGGAGVCGGYGCAIAFDVSPAFQGDFTAGLLIAF
jgi:hypothetical protein